MSLHPGLALSNSIWENRVYLLVLIGVVSGSNRLTAPDLEFINFARAIIGRKLNGSIIKEIDVYSESYCQFACVRETRCLSYKFAPAEDKKTFKCQLSDSDRFVGVKSFTKDKTYFYRGIQVISGPRDKIVINSIYCSQAYISSKNENRQKNSNSGDQRCI